MADGRNESVTRNETIPPVLGTAEGLAKLIIGTAAALLTLYLVYQAWRTGQRIPDQLLYVLGGFMLAFLGVDVLAILGRIRKNEQFDEAGRRRR